MKFLSAALCNAMSVVARFKLLTQPSMSSTAPLLKGSSPALGELRIAAPEDIARIGIVATAGFRYSPTFQWERPYHKSYPADTLLDYKTQFSKLIKNDGSIVLVVEDKYKADENNATSAIIVPDNGWTAPVAGQNVVVGVMSVELEKDSEHWGKLKHDGEYPDLPPSTQRDMNKEHQEHLDQLVDAAVEKRLDGDSELGMLVVHPAYWGKGHGTKLTRWAIALSEADGVEQFIVSNGMGTVLYRKLGYQQVESISVGGDDDSPDGVVLDLLEYYPEASLNKTNSGSLESM